MSKEQTKDLLKFLTPYPDEVKELALWLREFAWDLYPDCNELIYDNYNALAFGWSTTDRLGDTFCSVAVLSRYVHFGFFWGSKLTDPDKILIHFAGEKATGQSSAKEETTEAVMLHLPVVNSAERPMRSY